MSQTGQKNNAGLFMDMTEEFEFVWHKELLLKLQYVRNMLVEGHLQVGI